MPQIPLYIRPFAWTIFIVSGIILVVWYIQPKVPKVLSENTLTGKVIDYRANRIGDIDKLLIVTHNEKFWVHFPPHIAKMVMIALPQNKDAEITIGNASKKYVDDISMYEFIAARGSSASFYAASIPPPKPAAGGKIELSGTAVRYKMDEKGMVSGIIIDNYLVDLSPRIVQNIMPVIQKSVKIIVKGYERNADGGFVNITGLIVVKPYAISIDKTDYLL